MKTIFPVQGGFLARVKAPRIEAEGTFPTRELAEAGRVSRSTKSPEAWRPWASTI